MAGNLFAVLAIGLSLQAFARGHAPLLNLSAGAKLKVRAPILIRANDESEPLTPGGSGTVCRIRMKEAKPFDRVISSDREFVVRDVKAAGVSAPHRIRTMTYVEIDSGSVDDILCLAGSGAREPTIREFANAIGGSLALLAPEQGPREVD